MTALSRKSQNGAVLLIALVMLLMLTLLAVSSMRGATLESRITANRAHEMQLFSVADSALREAEFRFYGPGNLADKIEPKATNCSESNTLKNNGINKPCLLAIKSESRRNFVLEPNTIDENDYLAAESKGGLTWMPYRGTDPASNTEPSTKTNNEIKVEWNSILAVEADNSASDVEYGAAAEGRGTYFYLNNARVYREDQITAPLYLQSTHANIYLGLNN